MHLLAGVVDYLVCLHAEGCGYLAGVGSTVSDAAVGVCVQRTSAPTPCMHPSPCVMDHCSIGDAMDFGFCQAQTRMSTACRMVINMYVPECVNAVVCAVSGS